MQTEVNESRVLLTGKKKNHLQDAIAEHNHPKKEWKEPALVEFRPLDGHEGYEHLLEPAA